MVQQRDNYKENLFVDVTQTFKTKSEIARQFIQEQILSGKAATGSPITTKRIAEAVSMSETPVREAIKSLVSEGWLCHVAHQGTVVATFNNNQISEVFQLRGLLNAQAVRLSGTSYNEERLKLIDQNIKQSEIAVRYNDFETYSNLNRQFHELLCKTEETEWTYRLFSILQSQSAVFRHGFKAIPDGLQKSLDAHLAIRDALRSGDLDLAASLANLDEVSSGERLVDCLNKLEGHTSK